MLRASRRLAAPLLATTPVTTAWRSTHRQPVPTAWLSPSSPLWRRGLTATAAACAKKGQKGAGKGASKAASGGHGHGHGHGHAHDADADGALSGGEAVTEGDALIQQLEADLAKPLAYFEKELGSIRHGRLNPSVLDAVVVVHQAQSAPLAQLAQVVVKDARTLLVVLEDPSLAKPVTAALLSHAQATDAGFAVARDATDAATLRVSQSALNASQRAQLVKHVKQVAETIRVQVRALRSHGRSAIKRLGIRDRDVAARLTTDVQKAIDRAMDTVTKLQDKKMAELEKAH
ncbi:hypothetical protein CXG81DRAFT_24120 [Caulochytrium protostelioides]|uniref:Ribosome recycling factor domain-containing protein n=1 Tax=Caulochytrium protostelioides TaxID=1555241 RepID=A0A4P9XCR4_9FUNG|nr:hypothetical protein CXG81DRAFT_24120 [Caulochytrium protostelioides]|eukprot:RKP03235.1 hypothetical protein CXG81DRAFT_24120 [Caulochytrium protostelioides]